MGSFHTSDLGLSEESDDKIFTVAQKEQKMTYVTHMERIAEKRGKLGVAENMLKNGFSIKEIIKNTGLSEEKIMALKEKIKEKE